MAESRRTVMKRCFQLIEMFKSGKEFTNRDIREALGVTFTPAKLYIDAVGEILPIYETGYRQPPGSGKPAPIYKMLESENRPK